MNINFNFSQIKDYLINFLNSANTKNQVYLRFGILSLIVLVPCFLITANRMYSYGKYKNASSKMHDTIETNRAKILDLATVTTEVLEKDETKQVKDINFLADIGKIAEDTDNEITYFKPLPKKIVTIGENIEAFPVEIKFLGSFATLLNFLESIKKYDRICTVEKMDIKLSQLSYPYIESSLELVLFPFLNDNKNIEESLIIKNDPFKPFYYGGGEISVKRKTGDLILTGIVKEKGNFWAIVEVGGKGYIVKERNNIGEDIKITKITSDAVYLIRKEKVIRLRLEKK